jgi:hypothetical protein
MLLATTILGLREWGYRHEPHLVPVWETKVVNLEPWKAVHQGR